MMKPGSALSMAIRENLTAPDLRKISKGVRLVRHIMLIMMMMTISYIKLLLL